MPFVAGERSVAVVIEIGKLIPRVAGGVLAADHFEPAEHAIAVPIELVEDIGAAIPFASLDPSVVVPVEVVEIISAEIVPSLAQKLRLIQRAVTISIDATERFDVEVPFVRRNPAIAVVVEIVEARLRPADILLEPTRQVVGLLPVGVALRANRHFLTGQAAVAVPVVDFE